MSTPGKGERRLLSLVTPDRLQRILQRVFNEQEFLSPHGIRSLSRYHADHPYVLPLDGANHTVQYEPAESRSGMFGGNSNWRGPIWFPMNFLLVEALQRYDYYYGDDFKVEYPAGSGHSLTLWEAAKCISQRLSSIFLPGPDGKRPVYNGNALLQDDPHFRDYVLFYEYFNGDSAAGLGASHQTGWTGLVAKLLQQSGVGS